MTKPTKAQQLAIRESSYKPPPDERCETCRHFSSYGGCLAIYIRGVRQKFPAHPAGKCDLYERKPDA